MKWKTKGEFYEWNHIVHILLWLWLKLGTLTCFIATRCLTYIFLEGDKKQLYYGVNIIDMKNSKECLPCRCVFDYWLSSGLYSFSGTSVFIGFMHALSGVLTKHILEPETINCIFTCLNSYYSTHSRLWTCNHRCPQNEYGWIEAYDKIRLWRASQFWRKLILWTTSCKIVILLKRHAIETEHLMPFIWGKLIPPAQQRGKAFVWWLQKNSFSWVH